MPLNFLFIIFRKVYHTLGPTETTRGTARKFLTNVVGQVFNSCSVKRVLERENTKWHLGAVPKAYVCNWTEIVRVNLFLQSSNLFWRFARQVWASVKFILLTIHIFGRLFSCQFSELNLKNNIRHGLLTLARWIIKRVSQ